MDLRSVRTSSRLALLLLLVAPSCAFCIPGSCCSHMQHLKAWLMKEGFSTRSYKDGETIPLFVNKVFSEGTQLQYAYSELPFICPASGHKHSASTLISGTSVQLNLGEVFRGDRIVVSDYDVTLGDDYEIRHLCNQVIDRKTLETAKELIRQGYMAEWIVDNLPGATRFQSLDRARNYYAVGFKIGYEHFMDGNKDPKYYINNHATLLLRYRQAPGKAGLQGEKVIVGFEVYPKSIERGNRNKDGIPRDVDGPHKGLELAMQNDFREEGPRYAEEQRNSTTMRNDDENATMDIPYTYSVYFREEENVEWANRWDLYSVDQENQSIIHLFAIINSLVIAGFLALVVAVILARTVYGDIRRHRNAGLDVDNMPNQWKQPMEKALGQSALLHPLGDLRKSEDTANDDDLLVDLSGWKLIHSGVFRPPAYGYVLAPIIGSGTQLIFVSAGLISLSGFGVLSPSYRGGLLSYAVGLFVFAGLISGYFSARMYKTFGGQDWKKNAVVTASLVPGLLFTIVFVLNLFVWAQASSTALPFGTLVALAALWLFVQLPLVYMSSWIGFVKDGQYEHPIKAGPVPRRVNTGYQTWTRRFQSLLLAGLVPFLVAFIELTIAFNSMWQEKTSFYYMYGFLAVVCVVLVITVMETSIVAIYLQLCHEDYHWWWHSFLVGASSSLWIFAYCVWYFVARLHVHGFISSLLFFSYSLLVCVLYGLIVGTIGFLTAYVFVRRIYEAIKID